MSFGTSPAYDSPVSQPPLSQPPLDVRGSGRWQRRPYMTHSDYQQPEEMNHVHYSDRSNPSSRSTTQFPYARVPTAPSPVPPDVSPETSELTIKKKRKRADARQLEALNRMYARTAFPSTEERLQLAKDLDMSARGVQIWLAHTFVHVTCIISEMSTILSGSRTKGRRAVKVDEILLPILQSAKSLYHFLQTPRLLLCILVATHLL